MKPNNTNKKHYRTAAFAIAALVVCSSAAVAEPAISPEGVGDPTDKDVAGDVGKYFGQRQNLVRDPNRKLA